jgi:protein-disulfide isomerase
VITRRLVIAAAGLLALAATGPAAHAATGDMSLGNQKAKVTVVEYASVTCPHCAKWNAEVFPAFKAKYVDTGKVRYVFRELPTPPIPVAAAGFLVARCAADKYFDVVDALMRDQDKLYETRDARGWLVRGGEKGGLSEERVIACATDEAAAKELDARVDAHMKADKVDGTPTFFVGGKKVVGEVTLEALDKAIQPALAAKAKPKAASKPKPKSRKR